MPVHDWTRVDAGLFHAFHHRWIDAICDTLNEGGLPSEYYALPEQRIRGPVPDVLALKLGSTSDEPSTGGGLAVATLPPKVTNIRRCEAGIYANKTSVVAVRHRHGEVVSIIEIVSPGNKGNKSEFKSFLDKAEGLIRQKIHLMVIDLFPPTKRDPQGIFKAIWERFQDEDSDKPEGKPLTVVSVDAGETQVAYYEHLGVGDALPEMPLFLAPEYYVPAPLESTYQTAWRFFPRNLKGLLDSNSDN